MTIKPGPVKTSMTEGMKGTERFADVNKVAATIVKAIDAGGHRLRPGPVAAHHVGHPCHPGARLQEAESVDYCAIPTAFVAFFSRLASRSTAAASCNLYPRPSTASVRSSRELPAAS